MVFITKIRNKRKDKLKVFHLDILDIIWEIINDEDFQKLKSIKQHVFFNRYEHLLNVSRLSYKIAKFFKADIETCTLAWVLHDYHFTKIKSYKHWIISAQNAEKFWVEDKVLEIIKSHMYPSGMKKMKRSRWKDFWIVKFADSFSALYEIIYSLLHLSFFWKNKIKIKKNKLLIELLQEENYVLSN